MELKSPRRKKFCKTLSSSPLPVIKTSDGEVRKFTGLFDGVSVTVKNHEDKESLNRMGFFGKSNLSRSLQPISNSGDPHIIRKRQFLRRKRWAEMSKGSGKKSKVVVVPDSESEDENFFSNVQAEFQIVDFNVETLNLSLCEAYFLSHDVQCLSVLHEGQHVDDGALWTIFSRVDKFFAAKYATYYHFRRKNWITKPGIKFGGDFLLYKDGPPFYHASYVVVIDVLDEDLRRREDLQIRSMNFTNIVGLNRLCETAGKELLICQLIWPRNVIVSSAGDIGNISVNEVIMRRWIPNKEANSDKTSA